MYEFKKKDNFILKLLLIVKIIISLFLSYEIVFKGYANRLIESIGSYIVGGNVFIGLISTTGFLIATIIIIKFVEYKDIHIQKIKNNIFLFDIILGIITFIFGLFGMLQRGLEINHALCILSPLVCGTVPLVILMSVVLITYTEYAWQNKNEVAYDTVPQLNNNPFVCSGRIGILSYLITQICLFAVFIGGASFAMAVGHGNIPVLMGTIFTLFFGYVVLSLFATNKRLTDMGWSRYLLFVWLIPYVGIVVGLPMISVKSKYTDKEKHKQ